MVLDISSNKAFWDALDNAVATNDRSPDDSILRDVACQLEKLCENDSRFLYALGYVYYCFKSRRTDHEVQRVCMAALTEAINKGCDADLARTYLAFHHYDLKEYTQVLNLENRVQVDQLSETALIRFKEIILCSKIRLYGFLESIKAIEDYAEFISGLAFPDIEPLQLLDVLESIPKSTIISPVGVIAMRKLALAYPILGETYFSRLMNETVR